MEQDDEFIEFPRQDWEYKKPDPTLFTQSWETTDEFNKQLREQLNKHF
jgi:hypothetical protein